MRCMILGTSLFFFLFTTCMAQLYHSLNSLESIIDAEQVAMGESFVANRSGLTSFKQNPAALTGINYLTAYYSYRDNVIHDLFDKSDLFEFGLTVKNPIGVTNINYARFNSGENIWTDEVGVRIGVIYDICKPWISDK